MKRGTVYLAAYLSSKRDRHRNCQIEPDDFDYIKEYCRSIELNGLKSIIIVDECSSKFIKSHTIKIVKPEYGETYRKNNAEIRFKKIDRSRFTDNTLYDKIHLHDERFYYLYDVIASMSESETEYYMLTDISDVEVLNPVEEVINVDPNKLYIGRENETIDKNEWFTHYMNELNWLQDEYNDGRSLLGTDVQAEREEEFRSVFGTRTLLNCGTLYGHRDILLEFLCRVLMIMNIVYAKQDVPRPLDMLVFNYVAYRYYEDRLYMGTTLTTRFGYEEYDTTKALKHK